MLHATVGAAAVTTHRAGAEATNCPDHANLMSTIAIGQRCSLNRRIYNPHHVSRVNGVIPMSKRLILAVPFIATLGACVSMPTGPSVMVLPGAHKSFEQFRTEDLICRQYAQQVVAPSGKASHDDATANAIAGSAVGAAAGAMIGAASGQPGSGAAIGAGTGLLVGSAAGSESAHGSSHALQHSYDVAYMQCMYTKGNQLPGHYVSYMTAPPHHIAPPHLRYRLPNTPTPR
jgi:hypothetical protein